MAKRIWIFEPNPNWGYVGGVAIATTNTYERAVELLTLEDGGFHSFYRSVSDAPSDEDNWVLSAEYELATEVEEKTILNYNHA